MQHDAAAAMAVQPAEAGLDDPKQNTVEPISKLKAWSSNICLFLSILVPLSPHVFANKSFEKDRETNITLWLGLVNAIFTNRFKTMGLDKVIIACDERIAAKAGGRHAGVSTNSPIASEAETPKSWKQW